MVSRIVLRSSRRSTAGIKRKHGLCVCCFRKMVRIRRRAGPEVSVSIAADLREIKGKKLNRGNETRKTKSEKLNRGNQGKMKKRQAECLRMCDQWLWVPVSQEWLAGVFFFYMVDGQDRNIGTAQIWRDEISETLPSEKPVNCVFYRHDRTWNTYSPNMDNIQIVSMCVI